MDDLDLAPGERVVGLLKRNLFPYWAALALLGMALMIYAVQDDLFGWGKFLVGVVGIAFVGSMLTSVRYTVTDRRVVRTGWLGRREIARERIERQPSAFGETLVFHGDGSTLTVRNVKNAQELAL